MVHPGGAPAAGVVYEEDIAPGRPLAEIEGDGDGLFPFPLVLRVQGAGERFRLFPEKYHIRLVMVIVAHFLPFHSFEQVYSRISPVFPLCSIKVVRPFCHIQSLCPAVIQPPIDCLEG